MKLVKMNVFRAILPSLGICYKKVGGHILVTGFYKEIFWLI